MLLSHFNKAAISACDVDSITAPDTFFIFTTAGNTTQLFVPVAVKRLFDPLTDKDSSASSINIILSKVPNIQSEVYDLVFASTFRVTAPAAMRDCSLINSAIIELHELEYV